MLPPLPTRPGTASADAFPPPPRQPANLRGRTILVLLVTLGILVRELHFLALQHSALIDFPLVADYTDMWGYWVWSDDILAGDLWGFDTWHPYFGWMADWGTQQDWYRWWGGRLTFQNEPAYPYWVAGLRALGATLPAIIWLQLMVSALVAVPVYFLTRRFTSDLGAHVAAALIVLYGPLVFYAGTLLRDGFTPLIDAGLVLLTLATASATHRPDRRWVGVGVAMGVAVLIKYTTLMLALGLAIWALVDVHRDRRRMLQRAAAIALGMAIGVSPLIVRNAVVGAPLLQVCNRPLESFVMANVADVMPVGMQISPGDAAAVLRKADGRSSVALMETLKTYDGDWRLFFSKEWLRVRALADPFEVPNNLSVYYGERLSPILRWLPGWGLVGFLGMAGFLVVALRAPRRHAILLVYAATLAASLMVQFVIDRYRLGMAAVLCVGTGLLVGEIQRLLAQQRWLHVVACTGIVGVAAALEHLVLPIGAIRSNVTAVVHPSSYAAAVDVYVRRDDLPAAQREIASLRELGARYPAMREEISADADAIAADLRQRIGQVQAPVR